MQDKEDRAAEHALYRRLAPIQDAYHEQKNYKSVVKTCEASLKKDPKQLHIRCYLAMAKQQLGDVEEAHKIFTAVVSKIGRGDGDFVVRSLKMALEGSGQVQLYVQALETYVKFHEKTPNADSVKAEQLLFNTLFRLGDYQKAAKQATRVKQLATAAPAAMKDAEGKAQKSVIWSVMCNFWKFRDSGDAMSLMLAERMLTKMAGDGKLTSGEDIGLYCDVLRAGGKLKEARSVAEGPLGLKAFPFEEERLKFILKILEASDSPSAVSECCVKILQESADDWDAWLGAIESSSNGMLDVLELAAILSASHASKRGPRLASLEVYARKEDWARLSELILSYFASFGHKACFWGDVGRYAKLLGADKGAQLLKRMSETLGSVDWTVGYPLREYSALELESSDDVHREKRDGRDAGKVDTWGSDDEKRQREMMRRVAIAKLELTLAVSRTPEDCREFVRQYEASSLLYRKHLQITEEGPNDDLIMVAAHHLHAQGHLLDAAAVCVAQLDKTPHSFQPKLLLIGLAMQMGAFTYAGDMYRLLDCKYVQNDSMGHFALPAAVRAGDFGWLADLWRTMSEWRDMTLKRSVPADTAKCFTNGKWTQVEGFQHFARRVDGSSHFLACELEHMLGQAFLGKDLTADHLKLVVSSGRQRGLAFAGSRSSRNWIESVIRDCESYEGKKDLRLTCNYDVRVKADFTRVETKQEFLASEWCVDAEQRSYLLLRCHLILFLEATVSYHSEPLLVAAEALTKVLAGAVLRHFGKCANLFRALIDATAALASSGVVEFSPANQALLLVHKETMALKAHLVDGAAEDPFRAMTVSGWATDMSSFAFEVAPLAFVVSQTWKKFAQPTKSLRNKMSPETKATFSAMLESIKLVTSGMGELCRSVEEVAKGKATLDNEEAFVASAQEKSVIGVQVNPAMTILCHRISVSWKALMVSVGARTHALKFE